MSRIPNRQIVVKAIKAVQKAAQKTLQGTNALAGQRMAKGDYQAAESLASKGKEIHQFMASVKELEKRWREISRSGVSSPKKSVLPLWQYYQPILKALVQLGGESKLVDLETEVEKMLAGSFQSGDRSLLAGRRERWRGMVKKSRKALVAEGWIEAGSGSSWKITVAGRKASESPITESNFSGN